MTALHHWAMGGMGFLPILRLAIENGIEGTMMDTYHSFSLAHTVLYLKRIMIISIIS